VAAVASARLGLPHNPPDAARAARRKDELRRILRAARVPTPAHEVFTLDDDSARVASGRRYPVVLKPTFLAASRGVIRADNPEQFVAAFRRIAALLERPDVNEKAGDAARLVLVEEFIPGVEVAVEGLLTRGHLKVLAIFDKPDPLDGPYFEETLYVTPSRLEAPVQDAIATTTAETARALGLREGPIHAELRVNDRGPWLIEMAARSIGGLCSRVLRFATGLSLEEVILMHALGREVEDLQREPRPAGVMMIPIPRAGILRGVSGMREARSVPGVDDITISATIGRPLVPLPEGSSYLGFIFARGDSPAAVEAALREAHRLLRFDIEPVD
jgi:biotin carboxylase